MGGWCGVVLTPTTVRLVRRCGLHAATVVSVLLGGGVMGVAATTVASAAPVGAAFSAAPAVAARPAFVQQVSAHGSGKSSIAVTTGASVPAGDRLVVEVGVWNASDATTASVTDSTGDPFVEVTHFAASDDTEMSVWTAPVATGGTGPPSPRTRPRTADMGIVALEYSGLSTVADVTVVDQLSHASGITTSAATVSRPPPRRPPQTGELAVGFYADSGFGDTLTAGTGFTVAGQRLPAGRHGAAGRGPDGTGRGDAGGQRRDRRQHDLADGHRRLRVVGQTAPAAADRTSRRSPGDGSATVTWTAPPSGGSPITSYTVTPYVGGVAQPPTIVTGSPPAHGDGVAGLTNGTTVHVHGDRDQRDRHRSAVGAEPAGRRPARSRRGSGARCRPGRSWRSAPS